MKNLFCLLQPITVASCLLLSGCVKEPGPHIPLPPEPQWLLTRIVRLEVQGEPEGGPITYSAQVDEYRYNNQHKPWLHIMSVGPDTTQLKVERTDTLFYDNVLRPIRAGRSINNGTWYESRYYYSGNNKYPDRSESVSCYSTGGGGTLHVMRYAYSDSLVQTIHEWSKYSDTTTYIYDSRGDYFATTRDELPVYERYDNAVNAGRFLNLDFPAVNIPEGDEGPLFSAHNWGYFWPYNLERSITYDAEGKVSKSYILYSFPTRHVNSYYYYTWMQ